MKFKRLKIIIAIVVLLVLLVVTFWKSIVTIFKNLGKSKQVQVRNEPTFKGKSVQIVDGGAYLREKTGYTIKASNGNPYLMKATPLIGELTGNYIIIPEQIVNGLADDTDTTTIYEVAPLSAKSKTIWKNTPFLSNRQTVWFLFKNIHIY